MGRAGVERAVTAAILIDVNRRGDSSRFSIRGDARYQLRGSRLPEKAAAAEKTKQDIARDRRLVVAVRCLYGEHDKPRAGDQQHGIEGDKKPMRVEDRQGVQQ